MREINHYTNESALIEDIYDHIFGNDFDIGTDFISEFKDSFVDTANARIHLRNDNEEYIIRIFKSYDSGKG